jgi:hypothetical protein
MERRKVALTKEDRKILEFISKLKSA